MGRYEKLGKNTVLFMIGSFGQKLLAFVFVPFYTSVLTTAEYGISDLIVTIVTMLWPVFTVLINEAVMRFCLDQNEDKAQIVSVGFWLNVIGLAAMLLFSPLLFLVETLKEYYLFFVLYYCIYAVNSFLSYAARGLEKVKEFAFGGIVNTAVTILFNILFLLVFRFGVKGYLTGYMIGMGAASVWLLIRTEMYRYIFSIKKLDRQYAKEMVRYSIPLIPNSISWWINNSSDKFLVTYFCGVAVNGIYSVAYKIPSLLSVVSGVFMNAWQISAVENFGSEESRKFFSEIYRKYAALNIVCVSAITCFIQIICRILFLKDFYEAYLMAPFLVLGVSFQMMSAFLGTIYTAAKKTSMIFYTTLASAVANVGMNLIFIPVFGAVGAAMATCISYFINWLLRVVNSRKIMKLDTNLKKDIFLYGILTIQIVVWLLDLRGQFLYEIFLLLLVIVFQTGEIRDAVRMILRVKFKR